jgi:hypothetical protein
LGNLETLVQFYRGLIFCKIHKTVSAIMKNQ